MNHPSSVKTESRALNALEYIIDDHLDMDYEFRSRDKGMSWDGYIELYKPDSSVRSKRNAVARIPVQIKGHEDPEHKYINKKSITYQVDTEDLEMYSTEKGVLYFQIFIDKRETSVFYISLFPSKIADYLEEARRKNRRKHKNIPFVRLEKDSARLYEIVVQFHNESIYQGSAHTPLVENRIKLDDMAKVREISLSVAGVNNAYDAFLHIAAGDVCLYGKLEGDQYPRPIQWTDNMEYFLWKDVALPVRVGDTVYYQQYRAQMDKSRNMKIQLSPNLVIDWGDGRINWKTLSPMPEMYNDARFLKALISESAFYAGDTCLRYSRFGYDQAFEERVHFIIDLYETLQLIDLEIDNPFVPYDSKKIDQLIYLVNLRFRKPQCRDRVEYRLIPWQYGDKYYPVMEKDDGTTTELFSSVYSENLGVFTEGEENGERKMYRLPLLIAERAEILANLFVYRYDVFSKQIEETEINQFTYNQLLGNLLVLISVYDINSDEEFLALAERLLLRLQEFKPHDYITLNLLQIKERRTGLDENDITVLEGMDSDDVYTQFGKYVLLKDKVSAESCLAKFSEAEQEKYRQYPIYTLFSGLQDRKWDD